MFSDLAAGDFCREGLSVAWSVFGDRKPKSRGGRDLAALRVATKLLTGRQKVMLATRPLHAEIAGGAHADALLRSETFLVCAA